VRNIAVIGHGASGKTTLVDALAFVSGSSKRHGSVRDRTALTDFSQEEIERGFSIAVGCAHAEWMDTKINLLDTPGYLDFQGDAIAGLAAADGALLVVSATSGVEVGTERMFREAVKRRDPVLVVVSMLDKEHASFERTWEEIKTKLDGRVVPVEVPIGEGQDFHGIINLFDKKAHIFKKGTKTGEYTESDIPAEHQGVGPRPAAAVWPPLRLSSQSFLVGVPAMVLLLVLAPRVLPEYRDPGAGRLDLLSVVLSFGGVLPVVYALKKLAEGGPPPVVFTLGSA
jgi:small GTP-binding protein